MITVYGPPAVVLRWTSYPARSSSTLSAQSRPTRPSDPDATRLSGWAGAVTSVQGRWTTNSEGRSAARVFSRVRKIDNGLLPPSTESLTRSPLFAAPTTHAMTSSATDQVMQPGEPGVDWLSVTVVETAGWLFQVAPVSVHVSIIRRTSYVRAGLGTAVAHSVRSALSTSVPGGMMERSNSARVRSFFPPPEPHERTSAVVSVP